MKTLTVTEVARNFSAVMDRVEADQEEVVLTRGTGGNSRAELGAPQKSTKGTQ